MKKSVIVFVLAVIAYANCHPTMYKRNEKKLFEADLVPVSSTVIPLPIYQVSSGVNIERKDHKYGEKPIGPIPLLTSANYKKKAYPDAKPKPDDVSIVKEVSKKEFSN